MTNEGMLYSLCILIASAYSEASRSLICNDICGFVIGCVCLCTHECEHVGTIKSYIVPLWKHLNNTTQWWPLFCQPRGGKIDLVRII